MLGALSLAWRQLLREKARLDALLKERKAELDSVEGKLIAMTGDFNGMLDKLSPSKQFWLFFSAVSMIVWANFRIIRIDL